MKKNIIVTVLAYFMVLNIAIAQKNAIDRNVKKDRYNIAVLAPMYLDSFNLEKSLTSIPAYAMQGLEFYQGIKIAADTLNKLGTNINLYIYDSKSRYLNINNIIETDKFDSVDCVIGILNGADLKTMANFAKSKRINFISAVSPNDADQTENPFFTLLAPRLITHVEKMEYKAQVFFNTSNKILIHGNKTAEKNVLDYYSKLNNTITEKVINTKQNLLSEYELEKKLDKNKTNLIIMSIMDPEEAYSNLRVIHKFLEKEYTIKVIGMPTWENITALQDADEFPEMDIYYTTSIKLDKEQEQVKYISTKYKEVMGGATTDIVFKGFESLYFASHLLTKYGVQFNGNITESRFVYLTPYTIQRVTDNGKIKYNENKNLYLIHVRNGKINYE